jgi:hypothetical protein
MIKLFENLNKGMGISGQDYMHDSIKSRIHLRIIYDM